MNPTQYIARPLVGLKRLGEYITDRLVRLGLWPAKENYQRFIILGWYRTGSNYLVSLLNSHPQVVGYSEVFYPKQVFWGNGVYGHGSEDPADFPLRERDSAQFLQSFVFRPYSPGVKAVGFKIFYPQLSHEGFQGLKEALEGMKDLKVIHLKRENMLRILVSDLLAKQTGEKVSVSQKAMEQKLLKVNQIYLDPAETKAYFEKLKAFQDQYDAFFADHEVLQVRYDQLQNDANATFEKVFQFLGVKPRKTFSILIKQNTLPLSDLVANFEELRTYFIGTQWEPFFREEAP
ncbi:MAG: sulfotransferase [Bacteroidia bacterium]|nr:sulfotransferase [Bacteroidia bacterium]